MRTTKEDRALFVNWLHDASSDRLSIRAWAVGENMALDLDTLEAEVKKAQGDAAFADLRREQLELTFDVLLRRYGEQSAKLRQVEAENAALRALNDAVREWTQSNDGIGGGLKEASSELLEAHLRVEALAKVPR